MDETGIILAFYLLTYLLFFMLLLFIEKNLWILLWLQKYNCSTAGKDYFIPHGISNETSDAVTQPSTRVCHKKYTWLLDYIINYILQACIIFLKEIKWLLYQPYHHQQ